MTIEEVHSRPEETGELTLADFLENWHVWQPRLHSFAERTLRTYGVHSDRLDANDVVQQTWLAMWTAKNQIDKPDRYAYTVARSVIAQAGREGRRFTPLAPDTSEMSDADHFLRVAREQAWNSPVEGELLRQEMVREITKAKETLTRAQRVTVEGTVERSMPRAEVAAELGVGVNTLSAHRARALSNIGSHLARVGLYALTLFCVGSGLTYVLWLTISEHTEYLAAAACVSFTAACRDNVIGRKWTHIRQSTPRSVRVGIQVFLAVSMLAGIWSIWRFGLAAGGLSLAEGLIKGALAACSGLLVALWIRGSGPGFPNLTEAKDEPSN